MEINLDKVNSFDELWETELKQLLPDFRFINGFDIGVTDLWNEHEDEDEHWIVKLKKPVEDQVEKYSRIHCREKNGKEAIRQFPHLFHHFPDEPNLCIACTGWSIQLIDDWEGDVMVCLEAIDCPGGDTYPTQIKYPDDPDDLTEEASFKIAKDRGALKKMIETLIGMQEEINQLKELGRIK